ncbi:MAG: hypothetical protein FXF54_09375 [Kosmotoga sp.]|jgi:5-methylcytosine-specific restriction enzyme subunit McrC|nr:MAG: hypothetical protein FXF54_09375 [Kosmotoga sp.]
MFDNQRTYSFKEYETIEIQEENSHKIQIIEESFGDYVKPYRHLFENKYSLEASHFVGCFSVEENQFQINPKINMSSFFYVISKVYDLVRYIEKTVEFSSASKLIEHLLKMLLKEAERLLRQGLFSRYTAYQEWLNMIRGKVIMKSLVNHFWDPSQLECAYHEYSPNVLENQLVLKALINAQKIPAITITPARINSVINKLWAVEEKDLKGKDVDKVIFNKLNNRYKTALALSKFFLDNIGLKNETQGTQIKGFFIDMNKLFEKYIERVLDNEDWENIEIKKQSSESFARLPEFTIRPDIRFTENDATTMILDIKYKKTTKPAQVDLYQMNAYSDHFSSDVVLVYPSSNTMEKEYRLPNGHSLYITYLDLNSPQIENEEFAFIKRIKSIMDEHAELT